MQRLFVVAALLCGGMGAAHADPVWFAAHTLMPGDIVRDDDLVVREPNARAQRDGIRDSIPADTRLIGMEVKRRIYLGRMISDRDLGPKSAVKANTPVEVVWKAGLLELQMEGRALESGAVGEEIRVLNTSTSRTIRGTVVAEGVVSLRVEQ